MDMDFLIIGGGIAGVSAAARLAPLGSLMLLEAETALAWHASGRSAALYEPNYGSPPVVALSRASGDYFRQAEGVLSERGLLLLARAHEVAEFDHDLTSMDFAEISVDEALAKVPVLKRDVLSRAGFAAHAWDIDTDLLIQGFAAQARAEGARIVTDARITGLRRDGAGWQVTSTAGTFTARMIINAAGAWADEIAKLAGVRPLGFQPYRRSMARIPAPGGHDVSRWPMIFGAGETWYAKPDAGALIVSPAEEHPMVPHDAWADDMVLAEGLARYEEFVTEPVTRMLANWAGLRTFAPDRALVIGPDPVEPGFFWLAGQGGQGFQSSPAASLLAADLVAGRAPEVGADIVAAVSPARFG
ncbi:NAD(P)/FAD-dependent oxidoreductase [Szabonella alba]|uniref:FAD-binding oxidoreductase n=1 Tax=Szabonella alba TaxID=2804194 RepID=A0A8K0XYY4_9RHOB|nr:FAD-binding oxidoreductase [Szabonella alba]MBL4916231.1 FAD-binding oxidoreductase [Szabonella alba]